MTDPDSPALAAYWRFFTGFNSRTPEAWADGLNFPHARISPHGEPQLVETADDHVRGMSWQRVEASGWDHSVGADPVVVHRSDDCVHVVGGWSRFTRDARLIMTNHVGYVITRTIVTGRDHWGMQARFGIDPGPGGLTDEFAPLAVTQVRRFLDAHAAGDAGALRATAHLPLVRVWPGRLWVARTLDDLLAARPPRTARWDDVRAVQAGPRAANVAIGRDGGAPSRAFVLVVERGGRWGVQALSTIA